MSGSDKSINENTPGKYTGWYMDLEEYIRQGEPAKAEKSNAWKTAIGLQDVDGLKTSDYLLQTAKEHIEGKINIEDAKRRVQSYYEQRQDRKDYETGTMEVDIMTVLKPHWTMILIQRNILIMKGFQFWIPSGI